MAKLRCPLGCSARQWNSPSERNYHSSLGEDAVLKYHKERAEELNRTHPKNCNCPACSNYIYICQNCFLRYQQEPHQPLKILSSVETAKTIKIEKEAQNEMIKNDFKHIGDYCASLGPCAHPTGFKGYVPEWIRPLVLTHGLWRRFKPDLSDQGRRFLGFRDFSGQHYTYRVRYIVVDSDDYTDYIAEVYRKSNDRNKRH